MNIPIVSGDNGGPYTFPSTPPLVSSFQMTLGSTKVLFGGNSVMLVGAALTTGGNIAASSLFSTKTLVEGRPVHFAGSLTNLDTGWIGGTLIGGSVPNILVG